MGSWIPQEKNVGPFLHCKQLLQAILFFYDPVLWKLHDIELGGVCEGSVNFIRDVPGDIWLVLYFWALLIYPMTAYKLHLTSYQRSKKS